MLQSLFRFVTQILIETVLGTQHLLIGIISVNSKRPESLNQALLSQIYLGMILWN